MTKQKSKQPTKNKPVVMFRVECFGHKVVGLIYQEPNWLSEDGWTFRVDSDGAKGQAKCEWETLEEAKANAREWERGHLRFALECWCETVRLEGTEPMKDREIINKLRNSDSLDDQALARRYDRLKELEYKRDWTPEERQEIENLTGAIEDELQILKRDLDYRVPVEQEREEGQG